MFIKQLNFDTIIEKLLCVDNLIKFLIGIVSVIFCIVIIIYKPVYVELFMLLFLIPAIGLIFPFSSIKNSHIMGIITFILVIFILCISIMGYLNAYHTLTNLYLSNQINHVPTLNEINNCKSTYLLIILYAIYNIVCGVVYFIPTYDDFRTRNDDKEDF